MNDRQRLEAIVSVVCRYLPPDGIPINEAMSEIISLIDPLPPAPAQEPVCGWGLFDLHDGGKLFAHCSSKQAAEKYAYEVSGCRDRFEIHPLTIYTTKPAQQPDPDELTIAYLNGIDTGKKRKPWVGLTDEERRHLRKCNQQHDAFALAVEALLKEKNT